MKTIILLFAAVSFSFNVNAQQRKHSADEGFWVVEGNVHQNKEQIVKFYDSSSRLLYEEKFGNKKLKIEKPGTQKLLNGKLASLLENNSQPGIDPKMRVVRKSTVN